MQLNQGTSSSLVELTVFMALHHNHNENSVMCVQTPFSFFFFTITPPPQVAFMTCSFIRPLNSPGSILPCCHHGAGNYSNTQAFPVLPGTHLLMGRANACVDRVPCPRAHHHSTAQPVTRTGKSPAYSTKELIQKERTLDRLLPRRWRSLNRQMFC